MPPSCSAGPRDTVNATTLDIPVGSVAEVCRKHHIRRLSLFGSVARGEQRPDSDVDLLVEFEPDHTPDFFSFETIAEELGAVVAPGRYVDLVTADSLHWYIAARVRADAIPLYEG